MPDPLKKSVSASQSAALFNASPHITRWMLWHHFARGMPIEHDTSARMQWGKTLQPHIIAQAARELALECRPNARDEYVRAGRLGATRDATIICPDRGPGALETKCVFDYGVWMREWDGGRSVPRHIEIQLQQQMMVGDGEGRDPWSWGVVAVWVCADVFYFERKPILPLWTRLTIEASDFFNEVHTGREPDPFGVPLELAWLTELFPTKRGEVLDLSAEEAGAELASVAVAFRDARADQSAAERTCEPLRARILAAAKTAEEIICTSGIRVRITPSGRGKRINVFVPDTAGAMAPGAVPIGETLNAG